MTAFLIANMAPLMFAALVVVLLIGYPVAFALGAVGIINAGATANGNVDVETEGDMPSQCKSEYLIVVNNVNAASGNKAGATGYGSVSVDLGAPGDGTFTTAKVSAATRSDASRLRSGFRRCNAVHNFCMRAGSVIDYRIAVKSPDLARGSTADPPARDSCNQSAQDHVG